MNIKDIKAGMLILFKARKENERDDFRLALTDYDKTSEMVFCKRVFRFNEYDKHDRGTYVQLVDYDTDKKFNSKGICYDIHELYVDCDAIDNITKYESRKSDDGEFDDTVIIVTDSISRAVINVVNIFGDCNLGSDSTLIIPISAIENTSVKESLAELSKLYIEIEKLCAKARADELDVMKEIVSRTFFSNRKYHDKEC